MAYLCVVDNDLKAATEIKTAADKILQESQLTFLAFTSFEELDAFIQSEIMKDPAQPGEINISLLVVNTDLISELTQDGLQTIKDKYSTRIVLTPFEDPLKPLKKIETWPIENIIYKPFDLNILQEHLRFAAIPGKKLIPIAVHSSKENYKIEKLRRFHFIAISDFSFKINSQTIFEIGKAYKFYHFIFEHEKKSSVWAKPVHFNGEEYEFIFCNPTTPVLASLRKQSSQAQNKLKNIVFHGVQKNKDLEKVVVGLEFVASEDNNSLKDFFSRRFPDIEIVEITNNKKGVTPILLNLLVSEVAYKAKDLINRFGADVVYFHVTNDIFDDREVAEQTLCFEAVRMVKPVDRHYMSRMLMSFFPSLKDSEPVGLTWFTVNDEALFSETIIAKEFSEAAFVYDRETVLAHGYYQEFALPQDDETEIKILKARIQYVDERPQTTKLFAHQVIFHGIRDNLLKKIRLWMLQAHINKKSSEN